MNDDDQLDELGTAMDRLAEDARLLAREVAAMVAVAESLAEAARDLIAELGVSDDDPAR